MIMNDLLQWYACDRCETHPVQPFNGSNTDVGWYRSAARWRWRWRSQSRSLYEKYAPKPLRSGSWPPPPWWLYPCKQYGSITNGRGGAGRCLMEPGTSLDLLSHTLEPMAAENHDGVVDSKNTRPLSSYRLYRVWVGVVPAVSWNSIQRFSLALSPSSPQARAVALPSRKKGFSLRLIPSFPFLLTRGLPNSFRTVQVWSLAISPHVQPLLVSSQPPRSLPSVFSNPVYFLIGPCWQKSSYFTHPTEALVTLRGVFWLTR